MDGFDAGDSLLPGKWTTISAQSISSAVPIHGNYMISQTDVESTFRLAPADEDDVMILGCYVLYDSDDTVDDGNATGGTLRFLADGGTIVHVTISHVLADGSIRARRGSAAGTILGTSATALLTQNQWFHLAAKVTLSDTVGTVDVELDGVNVLSLSGIDTKNGGVDAVFDTAAFHGGAGNLSDRQFDDVYVCNGVDSGITGLPNNDFLGICRVDALLPTADSTPEDWSLSAGADSAALIDEAAPDGDTSYIFSDVDTEKTQVAMADLSDTTHVVFGVQAAAYARMDDAGPAEFRQGIDSDEVDGNSADYVLAETYLSYLAMFQADPDGGIAWTPARVNAAEAFVEVRV